MKYGEFKTRTELATYICSELTRTINIMGDSDGLQSPLDMFKAPRARKKDLKAKRKELMEKHNINFKDIELYEVTNRKG
tara:strand:- start:1576 stop:1812 length:237 start_codon:yes stop_codon:yes gene_type:complete